MAFMEVMLEYIVERLYFLVPAITDILGDLTPNLQVGGSNLWSVCGT